MQIFLKEKKKFIIQFLMANDAEFVVAILS